MSQEININHDGVFDIAVGRSRRETHWRNKEMSWSDFPDIKNNCIFAAYTPSAFYRLEIAVAIFMSDLPLSAKIKRLSIHNGLLLSSCNLYLAVRGAIAFLILSTFIFCNMPSTAKNASRVNHSNSTRTLDCESVNQFTSELISPNRLKIELNDLVSLEKSMEGRNVVYSVLLPKYGREVHLKPETAEKLIEAIRVLFADRRIEERKECLKIPLFSR